MDFLVWVHSCSSEVRKDLAHRSEMWMLEFGLSWRGVTKDQRVKDLLSLQSDFKGPVTFCVYKMSSVYRMNVI